jgi:hypothetical protein
VLELTLLYWGLGKFSQEGEAGQGRYGLDAMHRNRKLLNYGFVDLITIALLF